MDLITLIMKVPHLSRHIPDYLDAWDLANLERVCSFFKNIVEEHLKHRPHLQEEMEIEREIIPYFRSRFATVNLDCEIHMRHEDFHQIRSVQVNDEGYTHVHLVVTDKFEDSMKTHFIFVFHPNGHLVEQLIIRKQVIDFVFVGKYLLVRCRCSEHAYNWDFCIFDMDNEYEELLPSPPFFQFKQGILNTSTDILVIGYEKNEDEMFLVHKLNLEALVFEELCVLETMATISGDLSRYDIGNHDDYIVVHNACGVISVHDITNGNCLWLSNESQATHVRMQRFMMQKSYFGYILRPKSSTEFCILRLYSCMDGSILREIKLPYDLDLNLVRFDFHPNDVVLSYKVTDTQVIECVDLRANDKDIKYETDDYTINSIAFHPPYLLAVTICEIEDQRNYQGRLMFTSLRAANPLSDLERQRKMGMVNLLQKGHWQDLSKYPLLKVKPHAFVCYAHHYSIEDNSLTLLKFQSS